MCTIFITANGGFVEEGWRPSIFRTNVS